VTALSVVYLRRNLPQAEGSPSGMPGLR